MTLFNTVGITKLLMGSVQMYKFFFLFSNSLFPIGFHDFDYFKDYGYRNIKKINR